MYINSEKVSNHFTQVISSGPRAIAGLPKAVAFSSLIPILLMNTNKHWMLKCFFWLYFCFTLKYTRQIRTKDRKEKLDMSQVRAQSQLRAWKQEYDAKSMCFLPCQADPKCIHKGAGRWGPAAEFAFLWTGRQGLCACLRWPAPDTYLWLPKYTQ